VIVRRLKLRSKKILIMSHCVLNQNSVVYPLARSKGAFSFVKKIVESGVGIIQLPCPEFKFLGITRKSMTKEEYDTEEYRILCRKLFVPILEDLMLYIESGYEFCGIIGINESPSCSITGNRGIFMEEAFKILQEKGIKPDYYEVSEEYEDNTSDEVYRSIEKALHI
jgi:predicted secreted protein